MILNDFINLAMKNTTINQTTGCWLWDLYKDHKGYGRIRIGKSMFRIHRFSAIVHKIIDPNDLTQHALHKQICPNRHCWNPQHLYAGTEEDNTRDKVELDHVKSSKKRARIDTCVHGHDIGNPENCYLNSKGYRSCKVCKKEVYKRKKNLGVRA